MAETTISSRSAGTAATLQDRSRPGTWWPVQLTHVWRLMITSASDLTLVCPWPRPFTDSSFSSVGVLFLFGGSQHFSEPEKDLREEDTLTTMSTQLISDSEQRWTLSSGTDSESNVLFSRSCPTSKTGINFTFIFSF